MRPSKITVLGHAVKILPLSEQYDDGVMGYCDYRKSVIYIDAILSDEVWDTTLVHEVVHYSSDVLSLGLTEEEVSGIGTALYSAGVRIR